LKRRKIAVEPVITSQQSQLLHEWQLAAIIPAERENFKDRLLHHWHDRPTEDESQEEK
jgi:hypothetical protein